jgi:hypothetical protein
MYFYLMAKALKNEVALDFLENLKMGDTKRLYSTNFRFLVNKITIY